MNKISIFLLLCSYTAFSMPMETAPPISARKDRWHRPSRSNTSSVGDTKISTHRGEKKSTGVPVGPVMISETSDGTTEETYVTRFGSVISRRTPNQGSPGSGIRRGPAFVDDSGTETYVTHQGTRYSVAPPPSRLNQGSPAFGDGLQISNESGAPPMSGPAIIDASESLLNHDTVQAAYYNSSAQPIQLLLYLMGPDNVVSFKQRENERDRIKVREERESKESKSEGNVFTAIYRYFKLEPQQRVLVNLSGIKGKHRLAMRAFGVKKIKRAYPRLGLKTWALNGIGSASSHLAVFAPTKKDVTKWHFGEAHVANERDVRLPNTELPPPRANRTFTLEEDSSTEFPKDILDITR